MNTSSKLFLWAITSAMAGFLFGFDTIVISGAEQKIREIWNLSAFRHGLNMSAALWGTVAGSLIGGWPTERYGRRATLLWVGLLYFVSAASVASQYCRNEVQYALAHGQKIVALTAYDYPTARLCDESGTDLILVGDSLGMVFAGLPPGDFLHQQKDGFGDPPGFRINEHTGCDTFPKGLQG